jgi:hypothetical protein
MAEVARIADPGVNGDGFLALPESGRPAMQPNLGWMAALAASAVRLKGADVGEELAASAAQAAR